MARRSSPPVRHNTQRHARLPDAHGRALHAAPGRHPPCRGYSRYRAQLEACRRQAVAPGLCDPRPGSRGAVRRQLAQFVAKLTKGKTFMIHTQDPGTLDVVLIGAGIMSATFGTVLKELEPSLSITIFETLDDCAQESSQAWNNAGTGHAANCELNYTPQRADGSINISEALKVNTEFDLSRQLWSYLIRKGAIAAPRAFIHPCPHMSFVWGKDNVAFLRKRFEQMSASHCYAGIEQSQGR